MKIALAQLNLTVGDLQGNCARLRAAAEEALARGADFMVTPELALTGYPPEDLLLRPDFLRAAEAALHDLARQLPPIPVIVGHPQRQNDRLYNAASLLQEGAVRASYHKHCLPNYAVFDEKRYFTAGAQPCVVRIGRAAVGITICEDGWCGAAPLAAAKAAGAELIVNLNASPYHMDKQLLREDVIGQRARETGLPIVYVNLVGGQDELVFDGGSFVMSADGLVTQRAPACAEGLYLAEFEAQDGRLAPRPGPLTPIAPLERQVYEVLKLGVRDYVDKNGFPGVVLGLSGGVDSALTLAIAADALGAARVEAVMMPSPYTAAMSLEDARAEAEALGIGYSEIPIRGVFEAFKTTLAAEFAAFPKRPGDVTEENLQARIRGNLLMAVSNRKGYLVLTTGNKSEMAVGYATLYGDMAGGFAVIKDVPKTLVYRLSRYRNQLGQVIPERVLTRPPSAELAPDQKDTDSLPPYEQLDPIIEAYVEQDRAAADIVRMGYPEDMVRRVIRMIDRNEYKRRQAAPGVRISPRAFGKDRRYPITNRYPTWES
ncbi:MAG: NAD+ synthase [Pseudomonadota bacterium]|uniref:NAD+ synthase n=1 Tax=Thermithiobacillus tepidarius TaxID=929 RepID=UPI0004026A3B|nr:NAD+ synthase [Thermithiobacillus tepidarius]